MHVFDLDSNNTMNHRHAPKMRKGIQHVMPSQNTNAVLHKKSLSGRCEMQNAEDR